MRFLYFGMPKKISRAAEEEALHLHLKGVMRNYRVGKGWNQAYMGQLLGLTKAAYEKYEGHNPEKKLRKIPLIVLAEFAMLSGYSFDSLLKGRLRKQA